MRGCTIREVVFKLLWKVNPAGSMAELSAMIDTINDIKMDKVVIITSDWNDIETG